MADEIPPPNESDNVGARTTRPVRGPNREGMVAEYLPEREQWVAKTYLDDGDAGRVAALRVLHLAFPEVDDIQPLIDEMLAEFLPGKTSEKGVREEYENIFKSMFGGGGDESQPGRVLAEALGASLEEE